MNNLKTLLESTAWQMEDGMRMRIIDERFFTFNPDGSLFDFGSFMVKDGNNIIFRNDDFKGTLSATEVSDNEIRLTGSIVHFDKEDVELLIQPTTTSDPLPEADEIHIAAMYGYTDKIQEYLEQGGDINAQDPQGNSLLIIACRFYHSDLAKFLLDQGADATLETNNGLNAMHMAIGANEHDLFLPLIMHDLMPTVDETEKNSLRYAVENHASMDTLRELVKYGALVYQNQAGLFMAAMTSYEEGIMSPQENTEIISFLLEQENYDVNSRDEETLRPVDQGNTALIYASACGFPNVIRLLINKGADIDIRNNDGKSALDVICRDMNQDDESLAPEITQILNNAGLTDSKEDLIEEKREEAERLCNEGYTRQALDLLNSIEHDIAETDFRKTYAEIISSMERDASEEEARNAINFLERLNDNDKIERETYIRQVIAVYLLLWDMLPYESDNYDADRRWAESAIISILDKYIDQAKSGEEELLEYLAILDRYGLSIGIEAEEATEQTREAHKCAIKIYDKLIEIEPIRFTGEKCLFLNTVSLNWMEDHFQCLISLFELDSNNDHYDIENRLQSEFEQRQIWQHHYREENPDTAFHRCPVPRDEFIQLAKIHEENGRRKEADWYHKHICYDAPANTDYWIAWYINTIKQDEIPEAYTNAINAVEEFDWNRKFIWNRWAEAHVNCNTLNEALLDAYDTLVNTYSTVENAYPVFFAAKLGANLNQKNELGDTLLLKLAQNLANEDIAYILDNYIQDIDETNSNGLSTFYMLAEVIHKYPRYLDVLRLFAKAGTNPNFLDQQGETVLFNHVRKGHHDACEFLLEECGIEPRVTNHAGEDILQIAKANNEFKIEMLITRRLDALKQDNL